MDVGLGALIRWRSRQKAVKKALSTSKVEVQNQRVLLAAAPTKLAALKAVRAGLPIHVGSSQLLRRFSTSLD
jgi:hypothetical protein